LAKRFFLVISGDLIVCEAGLSIATVTPDPSAPNDIRFSTYAGVTLKFWCNHRMQSAVFPTV
jgi:hypothetical protein